MPDGTGCELFSDVNGGRCRPAGKRLSWQGRMGLRSERGHTAREGGKLCSSHIYQTDMERIENHLRVLQAEVFEEIATMDYPFEGIPTVPPRKDMDHMVGPAKSKAFSTR